VNPAGNFGTMELDALTNLGTPRLRSGGSSSASGQSMPPAASAQAAPEVQERAASEAMMRRAVESANRALTEKSRELTFEFDDDVGRVIVKLIDRKTGEVLRQIPSSEVVEIARQLETQKGAGALLRTHA